MLCESCGESPANVFFKAIINNKVTKMNLCESCAKERGILGGELNIPELGKQTFSPSDIIGGLLSEFQTDIAKSFKILTRPLQAKCPVCLTSFSSFKSSGFVGCAKCYEAFYPAMKDIVKRIHGSAAHAGKSYMPGKVSQGLKATARPQSKPINLQEEVNRLKVELANAVKVEAYEKAALLRDKIKELERKL